MQLLPEPALKDPAAQAVQEEAPGPDSSPGAHAEHAAAPTGEKYPALHATQKDASNTAVAAEDVPAGHSAGEEVPELQ